jgi:hypothetical protein
MPSSSRGGSSRRGNDRSSRGEAGAGAAASKAQPASSKEGLREYHNRLDNAERSQASEYLRILNADADKKLNEAVQKNMFKGMSLS